MNLEALEELRKLAYQTQTLVSKYTRMYGNESNGDRVADLLSTDAYYLGTKMLEIINNLKDAETK